jgi:hypothetical protein
MAYVIDSSDGVAVTRANPSNLDCWITTKVCATLSALLVLLVLTAPVLACRGPQNHRTILLDAIPQVAEGSEVIARVEILEVRIRELPGLQPFHVGRARVLQPIRGTTDGQIIEIYAQPSSCGGGLEQHAVGREGFIAGRFKPIAGETFFSGTWSNSQIGKF